MPGEESLVCQEEMQEGEDYLIWEKGQEEARNLEACILPHVGRQGIRSRERGGKGRKTPTQPEPPPRPQRAAARTCKAGRGLADGTLVILAVVWQLTAELHQAVGLGPKTLPWSLKVPTACQASTARAQGE